MRLLWDIFTQKRRDIAGKPEEACMHQSASLWQGSLQGSCHLKATSELGYC